MADTQDLFEFLESRHDQRSCLCAADQHGHAKLKCPGVAAYQVRVHVPGVCMAMRASGDADASGENVQVLCAGCFNVFRNFTLQLIKQTNAISLEQTGALPHCGGCGEPVHLEEHVLREVKELS